MRSVAATLGLSDVAVAKACRKADIPVPPRGHWARKQAGKRVTQTPLPLRFPGASDHIKIGKEDYHYGTDWRTAAIARPIPPPPAWEEDMSSVTERAEKIVGKVSCPPISTKIHPLIQSLLDKDEQRRQRGYGWEKPEHDTPTQKRRLKLLNAIFLAADRIGCRSSVDLTNYPREKDRSPGVTVGDVSISIAIDPVPVKSVKLPTAGSREPLRLTVGGYQVAHDSWDDSDEVPLESVLGPVVVRMLVAAELRHRAYALEHRDLLVKQRAEAEEALRRETAERKQKARELLEKLAQERVDRLLSQAAALDRSETIRLYVEHVRSRRSEINAEGHSVEKWAVWALDEADRIDPVKNGMIDQAVAEISKLPEKP